MYRYIYIRAASSARPTYYNIILYYNIPNNNKYDIHYTRNNNIIIIIIIIKHKGACKKNKNKNSSTGTLGGYIKITLDTHYIIITTMSLCTSGLWRKRFSVFSGALKNY